MRYAVLNAAFATLGATRLTPLIRAMGQARGVIFTLHRVLPNPPAPFAPNAILQVTPEFLETALIETRRAGFDIVTMDEALTRLRAPEKGRPFAVFTFDDAYRDNLNFALPILRHHQAPFTLYVPTALVDGRGEIWWQALEDIIAANPEIVIEDGEGTRTLPAATLDEKHVAFREIYRAHRTMPEDARVAALDGLAARYGMDLHTHCRDLVMDWAELKTFANDPLCTIGAHTVHHYELSKLAPETLREEMERSARILEQKFGERPRHFSFPIGGPEAAGPREYAMARDLGFASAVTTRPGGLYPENAESPWDLPRISLNGLFQKPEYMPVFLTGSLFTALSGGRKKFAQTLSVRASHPADDDHGREHPAEPRRDEIDHRHERV